MLLSPHGPQVSKVSPNGNAGPLQTSPSALFNSNMNVQNVQQPTQINTQNAYNPMTSLASQNNSVGATLGLQQSQGYGNQESLFGPERKGPSPASQYVRQELKLALSKSKQQNNSNNPLTNNLLSKNPLTNNLLPNNAIANNPVNPVNPPPQQQAPPPQPASSRDETSLITEIPMDILESIESLEKQQEEEQAAQQQAGNGGEINRIEDLKKEAHLRYQQFNELVLPTQGE